MLTLQILSSVLLLSASVFAQAAPEKTPCDKGAASANTNGQMQQFRKFHQGDGNRGSHRQMSEEDRAKFRKWFESQNRPHWINQGPNNSSRPMRPRPRPVRPAVEVPAKGDEPSPVAQPIASGAPVFNSPQQPVEDEAPISSATKITQAFTITKEEQMTIQVQATLPDVPAPVKTPQPDPNSFGADQPDAAPQPSTNSLAEALAVHNAERAMRGAGPVKWSDKLAASAQAWTDRCVYEHGGGKETSSGENIAAGYSSLTDAFNGWASEDKDYDPQNPTYSHFTAIVWKATTEIGCGVSKCDQGLQNGPAPFYSCIYNPAGNVYGPEGPDKNKFFDVNVQL